MLSVFQPLLISDSDHILDMVPGPTLQYWMSFMLQHPDSAVFAILGCIVAIGLAWVFLISKALGSHFNTPSIFSESSRHSKLKGKRLCRDWLSAEYAIRRLPLVSIIVPARNEQENIRDCLLSILCQKNANFEVIAVNDSSEDKTLAVMKELQAQPEYRGKLTVISVDNKPAGWTGKTWASQQGYLQSRGKILLFMDADGHFNDPQAIRLTVERMLLEDLDVLTGVPFLPLKDFWSKIVMPVWNLYSEVFGHGIADANDKKSKVAFVMGSYFMIRRNVFEQAGTYEIVRQEIQEDVSMGRLLKAGNYRVKMFKIDSLMTALWSRDLLTLWNGIRRTVVPVALQNKWTPMLQQLALIGMIIVPFLLWPWLAGNLLNHAGSSHDLAFVSLVADSVLCMEILVTTAVKGMWKYQLSPLYSVLCVAGAAFLVVCLAYSAAPILFGRRAKPVSWRGRPHTFSSQDSGESEAAPA